jgi:repressor LexA
MISLTKSQQALLQFIKEYIQNNGHSPTFRQIQSHFGFASLGSVSGYIKQLKKKGWLLDQKQASLTPRKTSSAFSLESAIPLIGYIAAGFPLELFPHSSPISVPSNWISQPDSTYVLKARGDTLVDEHILDGDLLVVEARSEPVEGEIMVGLLSGSGTIVKRVHFDGPYLRLESQSSRRESILLRAEEITIQGSVLGVIRNTQVRNK